MVVEVQSQDEAENQQLRKGNAVILLTCGCKSNLYKRQTKKCCCKNDCFNGSEVFHNNPFYYLYFKPNCRQNIMASQSIARWGSAQVRKAANLASPPTM